MGHSRRGRILVLHNRDFAAVDDPEFASRADVENAARDVTRALVSRGYAAEMLPVPADPLAGPALVGDIARQAPSLVFNLCESLAGDARHEVVFPSLFELAGVRYTGSGPLALGTALRKDRTKAILRACGVPTPAAAVSLDGSVPAELPPFPLIVKPAREDASTGIWLRSVVANAAELRARVAEVWARYRQPSLIEQFVAGRELYVSLLGNGATLSALPMHEVDFRDMPAGAPHIVTYDGKWDPSSEEYKGTRSVRATVTPALGASCAAAARAAFVALELRDYARVDLRVAGDGTPYVIDVNPNCDLSEGAGVCRAASFGGLDYPDLIERVVAAATARYVSSEKESMHGLREPRATKRRARRTAADDADAADAPPPAPRPRGAAPAPDEGRPVHARGAVGRARASRRRAR
ncbi:MAG: D-alanine--D-alanine ligase [Myxococcales bacterium]|nr:D-alanine--D-alanine ligase [Myxococcales bacterium]